MERVLSESNGVQIIRDDEYNYTVKEDGDVIFEAFNFGNKERACMMALSEYLKATGVIDRSYDDFKREFIPYDRLMDIAAKAIRGMTEREEFIDVFLTDEEAEFLDVVEKPYEIRTYHVTKKVVTDVTVAVHEDASEIDVERALSEYCDDLGEHGWEFEEYDFSDYDLDEEELTTSEMEDHYKEFVVDAK